MALQKFEERRGLASGEYVAVQNEFLFWLVPLRSSEIQTGQRRRAASLTDIWHKKNADLKELDRQKNANAQRKKGKL